MKSDKKNNNKIESKIFKDIKLSQLNKVTR